MFKHCAGLAVPAAPCLPVVVRVIVLAEICNLLHVISYHSHYFIFHIQFFQGGLHNGRSWFFNRPFNKILLFLNVHKV